MGLGLERDQGADLLGRDLREASTVEASGVEPDRNGGRRAAGSPTSSTVGVGSRRGPCWPARLAGS